MSIVWELPKTSKYYQTSNKFTATFNTPTSGEYDFNISGNVNQPVLSMRKGSLYLINQITVGGTISQEEYLGNVVSVPLLLLNFQSESQRIYPLRIPVVQYVNALEASSWFSNDIDKNKLQATLNIGQLSQDAELVGVSSISLTLTMSIWEIIDNGFIQSFKKPTNRTDIGQRTAVQIPMFIDVASVGSRMY